MTEAKSHFIILQQGYLVSTWLSSVVINIDHVSEVVFVMLLHCKLFFSPLFLHYPLWRSLCPVTSMPSTHLRTKKLCSLFLGAEFLLIFKLFVISSVFALGLGQYLLICHNILQIDINSKIYGKFATLDPLYAIVFTCFTC